MSGKHLVVAAICAALIAQAAPSDAARNHARRRGANRAHSARATTPAQGRALLLTAARQASIPNYTRTCANGAERVVLNPSGAQQLQTLSRSLASSNILQICHTAKPGVSHNTAIFDGRMVHVQFRRGTGNWRFREWGTGLRPSDTKLFSALIQLTQGEADGLRQMIRAGEREQGPEAQAGERWERGKIGTAFGQRGFNCTSFWSDMPLGNSPQPLWRILGLRSGSGVPRSFQRTLEQDANDRVVGICVYGPRVEGFGANSDQAQVQF